MTLASGSSHGPGDRGAGDLAVIREAFGCDDALAVQIARAGRIAGFERGQRAWPLSDRDVTTLLLGGKVQEIAYGRDGDVLVLCLIVPGELFGSLLGDGGQDEGTLVEACEPSRGAQFAADSIVRLMESYSCVAMAVTRQMARRLQLVRRRMVETVLLSASGRICAELIRLADGSADRVIRPVPVLSELAVQVQTTRETVSRTISQLEKRGILRRDPDGLAVVAAHRLAEMVY